MLDTSASHALNALTSDVQPSEAQLTVIHCVNHAAGSTVFSILPWTHLDTMIMAIW